LVVLKYGIGRDGKYELNSNLLDKVWFRNHKNCIVGESSSSVPTPQVDGSFLGNLQKLVAAPSATVAVTSSTRVQLY